MTKKTVYEKFDIATRSMSAYCINYKNKLAGRVVFTYSKSGVCTCYLQIFGASMVTGRATGHGYDKEGAAFEAAAENLEPLEWPTVDDTFLATAIQFVTEHNEGRGLSAFRHELENHAHTPILVQSLF